MAMQRLLLVSHMLLKQKITHIDLKVLYLNNNDKCLFILQNKKRNLIGFPVIVNHMYMNKAAREYHKH